MDTTTTRSEPAAPSIGNSSVDSAPVAPGETQDIERPEAEGPQSVTPSEARDRGDQDGPEILGDSGLVDDTPLEEMAPATVDMADTTEATAPRAPDEAAKIPANVPANINVLAGAIGLMMASPKHKHLFLADLEWALLPPLALKQYRLFTRAGKPVAFATWAFVSEEVAQRLRAGRTKLKPAEWKSGDKPILIDLITPFGGERNIRTKVPELLLAESERRNSQSAANG